MIVDPAASPISDLLVYIAFYRDLKEDIMAASVMVLAFSCVDSNQSRSGTGNCNEYFKKFGKC